MCSHILILTHSYTLNTLDHTHYTLSLPCTYTDNTWHACGTVHCTSDPQAHAEKTLVDRNSIGLLFSHRSEIPRLDHCSMIDNFDCRWLNTNLLVRSTDRTIGSHTNRLVHCSMGRKIVLCVCVFFGFLMWVEFCMSWSLKFSFLPSSF